MERTVSEINNFRERWLQKEKGIINQVQLNVLTHFREQYVDN